MRVLTLLLLLGCLAGPATPATAAGSTSSLNAGSCVDLTAGLSGGQPQGAPCGFFKRWAPGPPLNATVQGLTWDTGFAVSALLVPPGSHLVMQQLVLQRALLLPAAAFPLWVPLQPAILQLQPNSSFSILDSNIVTVCSTWSGLLSAASSMGVAFTSSPGSNSLTIQMYNTTKFKMSNVTITCDDSYKMDAVTAEVYSGDQLQSALAAISQLDQPGNVTLNNHTTLAGLTWPERGYNMSGNLDIYGNVTGTNTVLDLAGVSMFVHLAPGMLVRLHRLQVEGNCIARFPLLTRTKQEFVLMNDIWSVYTGNNSWPRVSKLLEVYDSTLVNSPQELYAVFYWVHLAAPFFPQLLHYAEDALHGLLSTLPAVDISALNATSITYAINLGPSLGQHNVTATIQPPLQLQLPGFSATTSQDCQPEADGIRHSFDLSDPQLAPDTRLAPLFVVSDSGQLVTSMVTASQLIFAQITAGSDYVPPMVLLLGDLTLPSSVSGQLLLWNRDIMLYGPYIQPPDPVPGNPTAASLNLNGATNFLRTSDVGGGTLFITHLTLRGLAQQPIAGTVQAALPLWFVLMKNRSGAGQLCLTAVTLVLPVPEWKQLYYAAQRGSYWAQGWGAKQPLIQGLADYTVGQFGATTAGVHLASLVGWGMNATNLYLVPDHAVSMNDLPSEMFEPPAGMTSAVNQSAFGNGNDPGNSSSSSGVNHGLIIGATIGGVVGVLLLLLAIVFVARHRRQRGYTSSDKKPLYDPTSGSHGSGSAANGSGSLPDTHSSHFNLASQNAVISVQAAETYHVKDGELHHVLTTHSRVDELQSISVNGSTQAAAAASARGVAGASGSSHAVHEADAKAQSGSLVSMPPSALGTPTGQQNHAPMMDTIDGSSTGTRAEDVGRTWASAPNAVIPQGLTQRGRPPLSEAAVHELDCRPHVLNTVHPSGLSSGAAAGTTAGSSVHGDSAKVVLERVHRSLTQQSSAAASTTQGTNARAESTAGRPDATGGLVPLGRHSSVRPRSNSQMSTSQLPSSMDSMGSQPRWDPKKEVAALAQDMKPDADKLVLLEPIGQGGFGAVYRGRWRGLEVAIKTVLFSEDGGLGAQQRAVTEAAVCTSVMHHNVVATYHYDIMPVGQQAASRGGMVVEDMTRGGQDPAADWKLFLIQEYCHASLYTVLNSKLMHQQGTPDMDLLLTTLLDVAQGMQYLHSKNILHGDLKPENVLLKNDATAAIGVVSKITDFGLSSRLDPTATHISNILNGTPFYAAPEVVKHGRLNKASDVYSFGVLMWEMYLATPPWIKSREGYQTNKLFPKFPIQTPTPYVALTLKCLDPRARARPEFDTIVDQLNFMHQAYLDGYDSLVRPTQTGLMVPQGAGNNPSEMPPLPMAISAEEASPMAPSMPWVAAAPEQPVMPMSISPPPAPAVAHLPQVGNGQLVDTRLGQALMGQYPVAHMPHMPAAYMPPLAMPPVGRRSQPLAGAARPWSEPGAVVPGQNYARSFPAALPPPQGHAAVYQHGPPQQHMPASTDAAAATVAGHAVPNPMGVNPAHAAHGPAQAVAEAAVGQPAAHDGMRSTAVVGNDVSRGMVAPMGVWDPKCQQEQRLSLEAMAQQQAAFAMAAGGVQAVTHGLGLDLQSPTFSSPNSRRDQTARSQAFTSMLIQAQAAVPQQPSINNSQDVVPARMAEHIVN